MDNTCVPFTSIIDSERKGGWTLGGNYAPGLALKSTWNYSVVAISGSYYYTRVSYTGTDVGILTVGPFPDSLTATQRMNSTKLVDGTS